MGRKPQAFMRKQKTSYSNNIILGKIKTGEEKLCKSLDEQEIKSNSSLRFNIKHYITSTGIACMI